MERAVLGFLSKEGRNKKAMQAHSPNDATPILLSFLSFMWIRLCRTPPSYPPRINQLPLSS